jgi:hypothetical protein
MQEQVISDMYTHRSTHFACRKAIGQCGPAHTGDKSGVGQYYRSAAENRFAPANHWQNVNATFRDSNISEQSRKGWMGGGGR